ncbi:MAG: ABC transporter ATP-binding protein [Anaerolineales bacterium]|nr:MAG: ABC transporter ATP-binding protein [Anaerolineales bacterium]
MKQDSLLVIEDLWLNRTGAEVLRGANLTVSAGEVHALLGLNGSGKTSLAMALMGASGYEPDRGTIQFGGKDITRLSVSERARLGLTLAWQEPARFEGIPVADYLALGMEKPSREGIEAALSAVALSPSVYLGRSVDSALSGGERKRIELAAVYVMEPRLAILDEPDSGVDVLCLADILTLVRRMADEGMSVLLITHRDEMAEVADSASLMCGGAVVETGTPAEVREYYARRCRPHGEQLGSQPWGAEAGGTYQRVVSEGVCDE